MRLFKWMCRHRRDNIRNEVVQDIGVVFVASKMREMRFRDGRRWYADAPIRRCARLAVAGFKRGRHRPKRIEEGN